MEVFGVLAANTGGVAPGLLDLAFSGLPEPTLVVDEEGRLRAANEAAAALLGPEVMLAAFRGEKVAHAVPWLQSGVWRVLDGADEAGLEAELGSETSTPGHGHAIAARIRRLGGAGAEGRGAVIALEDVGAHRVLEARQRSAERLAALGTLASGLAHGINNPLSAVVAGLAFAGEEHRRLAASIGTDELREATVALDEANEAAQRVGRVVRSLQSFGQTSAPFLAEVEVGPSIERAAALAAPELAGKALLSVELIAPARVRASESLLVELFLALLANAAQAIPEGAEGEHRVRVELDVIDGEAWVAISDTGRGLAEEVRERAFDPFFTTRPGHGMGLGLSVSHGIVTALGGSLTLGGTPGRGATATVRLPLAS